MTDEIAMIARYMVPSGKGVTEHPQGMLYLREDVDPLLDKLEAERDAERTRAEKAEASDAESIAMYLRARDRAEKAEAEVERLVDLHASGCFVEYDNGDRVRVWGWAGGADTAGALSTLSVSYEASDGARWSRTYRATGCWEAAPRFYHDGD